MNRLLKISSGRILFVSDIQGNLEDFDQILSAFKTLRLQGKADFLVIGGDLVHGYPGYRDHSFHLLGRMKELMEKDSSIIFLMGNHELSHVLHWKLRKGNLSFVEGLEQEMAGQREDYARFLSSLPFGIISGGGVLLMHTGPSLKLSLLEPAKADDRLVWDWFWNLDFQQSLETGPIPLEIFDPDFGSRFLQTTQGEFLWEAFMNKNEFQIVNYPGVLTKFLKNFSPKASFLVSGHIPVAEGALKIAGKQMKIKSLLLMAQIP